MFTQMSQVSHCLHRFAEKSGQMPNVVVDDFLLVARVRRPGSTPIFGANWTGPFRLVGSESPHLYYARNIFICPKIKRMHVAHLRFYSDG